MMKIFLKKCSSKGLRKLPKITICILWSETDMRTCLRFQINISFGRLKLLCKLDKKLQKKDKSKCSTKKISQMSHWHFHQDSNGQLQTLKMISNVTRCVSSSSNITLKIKLVILGLNTQKKSFDGAVSSQAILKTCNS